MDWRDDVMAEVGRGMGMEGLNFGGSGVISLEFEQRGMLFFEQQEEGVLLYQIQNISRHDNQQALLSALQQCHYTKVPGYPLQTGLKGDEQLFFLLFLSNEDFTRPNVDRAMDILNQQFVKIGNG